MCNFFFLVSCEYCYIMAFTLLCLYSLSDLYESRISLHGHRRKCQWVALSTRSPHGLMSDQRNEYIVNVITCLITVWRHCELVLCIGALFLCSLLCSSANRWNEDQLWEKQAKNRGRASKEAKSWKGESYRWDKKETMGKFREQIWFVKIFVMKHK